MLGVKDELILIRLSLWCKVTTNSKIFRIQTLKSYNHLCLVLWEITFSSILRSESQASPGSLVYS